MNILFLIEKSNKNYPSYLKVLSNFDSDRIFIKSDELNSKFLIDNKIDIILKDRYKYADSLKSSNIDLNKIPYYHFHPGYLPYNMKMDSNLWSIINNTPKGSTIIRMYDLDWKKYDIILRQEITYSENDTLSSSFEKCCDLFKNIFIKSWPRMRDTSYKKIEFKLKDGKIYDGKEKKNFLKSLIKGYETKVNEIPRLWEEYNSN
tara:strand:+ start:4083 stop:4694 length:612 start_codon:yes stop_codon:yes gene_type:complete